MSEWQPIETAPQDGTPILLTDGVRFAGGQRSFRFEGAWTFQGPQRIPNPDAGKQHEWWQTFGCSAFGNEAEVFTYDGPVGFEPTHWMPLPDPPKPSQTEDL